MLIDCTIFSEFFLPNIYANVSGGCLEDYLERVEDSGGILKYRCSVCGKLSTQKTTLIKHLENIHFPDVFTYSCKHCGETFGKSNLLYMHISRHHKK